jgi:hypothetical protein
MMVELFQEIVRNQTLPSQLPALALAGAQQQLLFSPLSFLSQIWVSWPWVLYTNPQAVTPNFLVRLQQISTHLV